MLGAAGVFFVVVMRDLEKAAILPWRDPYLVESLHYHV